MSNHVKLLDTHTYDGKLNVSLLPDLECVKLLSLEEKQNLGWQLVKAMKKVEGLNPQALHYLTGVVSSMGTPANLDPTNMLVADDLICLCWAYRKNHEFMIVLQEQLIDMKTGFCPQGRTHRLFQTLLAFK